MSIGRLEIEGQDFGEMELKDEVRRGEICPCEGQAFFCSYCGRVWARVIIPGRRIFPWTMVCSKCTGHLSMEIPGSIWMIWDRDFVEALPPKALEREFELTYQHYQGAST